MQCAPMRMANRHYTLTCRKTIHACEGLQQPKPPVGPKSTAGPVLTVDPHVVILSVATVLHCVHYAVLEAAFQLIHLNTDATMSARLSAQMQ